MKRADVCLERVRGWLKALHDEDPRSQRTTKQIERHCALNSSEARRALLRLEAIGEVRSTYERVDGRAQRVWGSVGLNPTTRMSNASEAECERW